MLPLQRGAFRLVVVVQGGEELQGPMVHSPHLATCSNRKQVSGFYLLSTYWYCFLGKIPDLCTLMHVHNQDSIPSRPRYSEILLIQPL